MAQKVDRSNSPAGGPAPGDGGLVLVTGSSGHLGANLVHRLVEDSVRVRVLLRKSSNNQATDDLDVEHAHGDLRDADAVTAAVAGCRQIYHCAAHVSTIDGTARHKREIFDSNVIGTRHLLRAARQAGVEKVVVSGSFSAFGYDLDNPLAPVDETHVLYPFGREMPYSRTKVLVEQECLRAAADGLPVVVATSTAIVGAHDYKPSRLGRTMCDFAAGKLRFIVPGNHAFVAARDIVEGHILAMAKGRSGQSYIISSEFLSLDQLVDLWADVIGRRRSDVRIPSAPLLPIAEIVSFIVSRLFPAVDQRFTPGAIRRIRHDRPADITKARTELGFAPSSIRDAVEEAYLFHCRQGSITAGQHAVVSPATLESGVNQ